MIFLRKRRRLSISDCHNIILLFLAHFCALPLSATAKFRICGFRLTMTMTALCKNQLCGGYFIPTKKRSLSDNYSLPATALEQENEYERRRRRDVGDEEFAGDYRPLSFQKRYSIAHGQVFGKRSGIANECCEKRCSLAYLRTYCCSSFQIGEDSPVAGGNTATPVDGAPPPVNAAFSYSSSAPQPPNVESGIRSRTQMMSALAKLSAANRGGDAAANGGISKVKQAMMAAKQLAANRQDSPSRPADDTAGPITDDSADDSDEQRFLRENLGEDSDD